MNEQDAALRDKDDFTLTGDQLRRELRLLEPDLELARRREAADYESAQRIRVADQERIERARAADYEANRRLHSS